MRDNVCTSVVNSAFARCYGFFFFFLRTLFVGLFVGWLVVFLFWIDWLIWLIDLVGNGFELDWIGLDWFGLDWIGLSLIWFGLNE